MKKTSKIIVSCAIIALMGAGCAKSPAANSNTNEAPAVGTSSVAPASGTFTVTIQPDGQFDPVTAFVKVGTKVIFKNSTDKPHRVASDENNSPEAPQAFSSPADIAPNGTFETTMSKAGRVLYHDPLNTAFGGAIEVRE
jgi:plastocyanin